MLGRVTRGIGVCILLAVAGWAQSKDPTPLGLDDLSKVQVPSSSHKSESPTANGTPGRPVKSRVPPIYPEIAMSMGLSGTVQLQAVVRPDGTVKEVHVIGGHPMLATAAEKAVMKWRYEPTTKETVENVKITFSGK